MTHLFALAVQAGDERARALAERGVARLLDGPLRDSKHDGWFPSTGQGAIKSAYDHAFVLLAAASATQAGVAGGFMLLTQALPIWDLRFWDPASDATVEQWNADWSRLDTYRGANGAMHTVEALLAVADAVGGTMAPELQGRALALTERLVHREARGRGWRLPEHFDSHWQADLDYNRDHPDDAFRPFGVTVGHQFEWARLCVHLDVALQDAPSWLRADAASMYHAAKTRGWGCDGAPGFVYTLDWQDSPVVRSRMHWVHAEAMAAAAVLGRASGETSYDEDLKTWASFAAEQFVDPTTNNWHHELDPDGGLSSHTWPGQPDAYHVTQALLLADLPLCGSIAEGLRLQVRHDRSQAR